ncbi:MAG: hypothetical protein J7555_11890, partial [Chloroflexi bacterium]|nr:hypothetical protein [Chloroflexota bacterium]
HSLTVHPPPTGSKRLSAPLHRPSSDRLESPSYGGLPSSHRLSPAKIKNDQKLAIPGKYFYISAFS